MTNRLSRQTWSVIGVLMAIALGLRGMLAARSGLGVDEATFLFLARSESWGEMLRFLQQHESHPPLFYGLMRVWTSLAGPGDSAALAMPVVLGVALVPAIFMVGISLFSVRAGIIAAAVASVQPALVEHSAMVRPYSLLPLLALASAYTLARGLQRNERRIWLAHAAATLAVIYTHNWGWLVLGGQWVAAVAVLAIGKGQRRGITARAWCMSQIVVIAAYLPWAPWLIYQTRYAGHAPPPLDSASSWLSFAFRAVGRLLQATIVGYTPIDDSSVRAFATRILICVVCLLAAVGAMVWLRARRQSGRNAAFAQACGSRVFRRDIHGIPLIVLLVVPAVAWALAVVLSLRSNVLLLRCVVTLSPLLILSFAFWLASQRVDMLMQAWPIATVVVATYGATLYTLAQLSRSNAREVAIAVAARTKPSDLVIIAPEFLAASFNRYYSPGVEQIDFPHFGREGAISFSRVRERTADSRALDLVRTRIAGARQAGRRVWFITDRRAIVDLNPEDIRWAESSPDYFPVAVARTNQIRHELSARYGPPDTSVAAQGLPPGAEHLRVLLFVAPEQP